MSGFDLNPKREYANDSSSQQLSLMDQTFRNSRLDLDFVEHNEGAYSNHSDLHLLANMQDNSAEQQRPKYFAYSTFLHIALAVSAAFVEMPKFDPPKVETIEVELEEPTPELLRQLKVAKGEDTTPTVGAAAPDKPIVTNAVQKVQAPKTETISEDKIVVAAKKSPKAKSPIAKARTFTGGGKARVATKAPSRAGVPESLEDIAAPKLDADGVEFSQVGKLGENEFEDDFKNVDHASAASVKALKNSMDDEIRQIADEKDEELKAMEDENKAFAHQVDAESKARRMKDAQAIASAQAAEQAAIERAAQNAAKAEAIQKMRAAAAAAATGTGQGMANKGAGSGNIGEDNPNSRVAGDPNGVRSLDQLRQMPGNPRPQYSTDERLHRHQGEIVLHAYVTKDGTLTNFKLLKSTSFRNLDAKTLASLKKWRFYPGQQGWVELPFRWDLKGGVQEVPTYLRRK